MQIQMLTIRLQHKNYTYVKQNVAQQSSGSQTPELQGDKDRVIVNFN